LITAGLSIPGRKKVQVIALKEVLVLETNKYQVAEPTTSRYLPSLPSSGSTTLFPLPTASMPACNKRDLLYTIHLQEASNDGLSVSLYFFPCPFLI
jgi:hypothetical protein